MAKMPPPGVAGSKKAVVTHDPAFFSCAHTVRGNPKTVAERVVGAGQECAAVNPKTHALGSPFEGRQADKDPAQSQKIHVEAKCYRVYFAHDTSIKDASLVLLDSAGDVVATSADTALPEDGQACFSAPDDVTLVFGVGTGEGRYATQVWGE